MRRFKFGKLVRDKIVKQQIASGAKPKFRVLSRDEHAEALIAKLIEEAQEIPLDNQSQLINEIADIQQVLDDLKKLHDIQDKNVSLAQSQKNKEAGAFSEGIYVEYVDVADDDKWVDYYIANSDRYPEITE